MVPLPVIREQLKYIGAGRLVMRLSEVRALPSIMWPHEEIKKAVYGSYEGGFGLLLATDKRMLFVDKRFFHLKCIEIPYEYIMGVTYDVGYMTGILKVSYRGGELEIKGIRSRRVRDFAEYLDVIICVATEDTQPAAPPLPHTP